MGVALELVIIPLLLLTAIVVLIGLADIHVGVVVAGVVFLAILYLVVVNLLKQEQAEEVKSPAPGEEELPAEPVHAPDDAVEREEIAATVAGPERPETEHRSPGL